MSTYHIFQNNGYCYLYLTDYKQLFCINSDTYHNLLCGNNERLIIEKYIALVNDVDCLSPVDVVEKHYALYLCVSNSCNLNCLYCFASGGSYGKKAGFMNIPTARRAIDWFLDCVPDDCHASIIFFGGEPLLSFNTIQDSCEYILENYKMNVHLHVVTNATLLTKEMIDFFSKNKFGVSVSIDGGQNIQNKQRPMINGSDSYCEAIKHLPYLLVNVDDVNARATYSDFTYNLTDIYSELLCLGFNNITVSPDLLHINNQKEIELLLSHLEEMIEYMLEYVINYDKFPFGTFIRRIRQIFSPRFTTEYNCGLGSVLFAVDYIGDIYPCHRFCSENEMIMGNVLSNDFTGLNLKDSNTSKCTGCWNKNTCPHGCRYDDSVYILKNGIKESYWCAYSKKLTEISLILSSKLPTHILENILRIDC